MGNLDRAISLYRESEKEKQDRERKDQESKKENE